jgi:hypothetical protein
MIMSGSLLILFTFLQDYGSILLTDGLYLDYANILHNQNFLKIATVYIPQSFNWIVFWAGEFLIILGTAIIYRSAYQIASHNSSV